MTSKQIELLKRICSDVPTKDCIVACKWIHPEVDGGFPITFIQLANGEGVMDCMATAAQFNIDETNCPLPDGTWHCRFSNDKFYINGKEAESDKTYCQDCSKGSL